MRIPAQATPAGTHAMDDPTSDEDLGSICALHLAPEHEAVARLLPRARLDPEAGDRAQARARRLIAAIRGDRSAWAGWDALLHEYSMSSAEGLLLLGMAEALLRIPDPLTAQALLVEKLAAGDWSRHFHPGGSLLANAAAWGLGLGGRLCGRPDGTADAPVECRIEDLVRRLGEPVLRHALTRAIGLMADRFILGRDIEQALERAVPPWRYSFDMLGEAALTARDAQRYCDAYTGAVRALARRALPGAAPREQAGISVKLSALHPRFEPAQRRSLRAELLPRLIELARLAREAGIGLCFDAEESERLVIGLELIREPLRDPRLSGYEGIGLAVQSYQKRSIAVIEWVIEQARARRAAIAVRLVKGAYWDGEIKRAQQLALPEYPVFTRKAHTEAAYLACARAMLEASGWIYPMFATHNARTAATVVELAPGRSGWEFQRLQGMGESLHATLLSETGVPCRVYAPVGSHRELLPYLVRRLLENGANNAFLNRLGDLALSIDQLAEDPVAGIAEYGGGPHPDIPLPPALCLRPAGGGWRCATGISPADSGAMAQIETEAARLAAEDWLACPIVGGRDLSGPARPVFDPSDHRRCLGQVIEADQAVVAGALARLSAAAPDWDNTPVAVRAACLERAAQAIEDRRDEFVVLLGREAGRTRMAAIAEVREAADLCRYYAMIARRQFGSPMRLPAVSGEENELSWHGRGVFACISPWNFPLSIFTGQVAAALLAGNCVAAKPAEQTPLVACAAARALLGAGVPPEVLALLPGAGETVGAALVGDDRVKGVAFTGSVATARRIHAELARRAEIVALIAETGGLNCMVADSSALPEQVAADALVSAFDSAGQRCSSLRVLLLQEEIAGRVIELLCGAMDELRIGDPLDFATDIGPLIDEAALRALASHLDRIGSEAAILHRSALPPECRHGTHFAPTLVEVARPDTLREEVFGPILHVLRYRPAELDELLDRIQAAGYGLTLGIQSRIDGVARRIRERVRVGNCYVNRSMIGAQVGMQPFGGEGLSGTGPKAGGPHYLGRFAVERLLTTNTAALGGNAALLGSLRD